MGLEVGELRSKRDCCATASNMLVRAQTALVAAAVARANAKAGLDFRRICSYNNVVT
jgi:hypothetical protein